MNLLTCLTPALTSSKKYPAQLQHTTRFPTLVTILCLRPLVQLQKEATKLLTFLIPEQPQHEKQRLGSYQTSPQSPDLASPLVPSMRLFLTRPCLNQQMHPQTMKLSTIPPVPTLLKAALHSHNDPYLQMNCTAHLI